LSVDQWLLSFESNDGSFYDCSIEALIPAYMFLTYGLYSHTVVLVIVT
jgi:hypothetical protein